MCIRDRNIPCIVGERNSETQDIFKGAAEKNFSTLLFSDEFCHCRWKNFDGFLTRFVLSDSFTQHQQVLETKLHGAYQAHNIALLYAISKTIEHFYQINYSQDAFKTSLLNVAEMTYFIGRWQQLSLIHISEPTRPY